MYDGFFFFFVLFVLFFFFFQAEDGIRDHCVTGVQTCALPIPPTCWKDNSQNMYPGKRLPFCHVCTSKLITMWYCFCFPRLLLLF